jgi:phosphopantetheine--protein transferase-like protein
MLKCGVDLVFIPEFEKRLSRGKKGFLRRIFLENELGKTEVSHLAGVFAAKEAVVKALGLPPGSWHRIEVYYQKNGQPEVRVDGKKPKGGSLSISHSGEYALAVFVVQTK